MNTQPMKKTLLTLLGATVIALVIALVIGLKPTPKAQAAGGCSLLFSVLQSAWQSDPGLSVSYSNAQGGWHAIARYDTSSYGLAGGDLVQVTRPASECPTVSLHFGITLFFHCNVLDGPDLLSAVGGTTSSTFKAFLACDCPGGVAGFLYPVKTVSCPPQ